MKWKNIMFCLTAILLSSFLFSACQRDPDEKVVISKNDGAFDAGIVVSADKNHTSGESLPLEHSESFSSTDNSVTFQMKVDTTIGIQDVPIVEASPHYLTEADVQRIAEALFGDVQFFEKDQTLSRSEIQECINRWIPYTNREAMGELLPNSDEGYLDWRIDLLKRNIEAYTKAYESAAEDNPHIPCQWVYHKDSYYSLTASQYLEEEHEEDNDSIQVTTEKNGIPYYFSASIRNNTDYKLSSVFAFPQEHTIGDNAIYISQLCRTEKPTSSQIEKIKEKAEAMLKQMQMGDWKIDEYYLESTEMDEFIIHINAVPQLCGVSALRIPQLGNLKSEEVFSSNYYLTNASFEFSPAGDLLYFELQSPVDISTIVNNNVAILDFPTLLEYAKQTLSLTDIYTYDFNSIVDICKEQDIKLECIIEIDKLQFGLIRVKKPNTDESYYYIPGVILNGNVAFYKKNTGELLCCLDEMQLLALNAIDGSVIQLSNE